MANVNERGNYMAHTLRECCGTLPNVKVITYPGTTYDMFVIECSKCGMKTQPYRRLDRAYNEWNHPEDVHLN